jgi:hypothetical protein
MFPRNYADAKIVQFAPWPDSLPTGSDEIGTDLDFEISNGDLFCDLVFYLGQRRIASKHVLFSCPVVYAVTHGDIMSQSFISTAGKLGQSGALLFEVLECVSAKDLTVVEPGLNSMLNGPLRHFVLPSDDRWVHVLSDQTPHLEELVVGDKYQSEHHEQAIQ